MPESTDNKFMKRCLDLAVRAEGMTYPNPLVGSVIVYEGVIIGEGYHLRAGAPHAEVNAINSVSDKLLLSKSTLYVSLEPCSHSGKTPPCADFIVSNNIPRVVVGTADTSSKVSGRGISRLKTAGCDVICGILEAECRSINRRFFTFHEKGRPYITLKWAQSADGYIDVPRNGKSKSKPAWITGKSERVLVHRWRASEQSILVGAHTGTDVTRFPWYTLRTFDILGMKEREREEQQNKRSLLKPEPVSAHHRTHTPLVNTQRLHTTAFTPPPQARHSV